jgi:hypothetical protein
VIDGGAGQGKGDHLSATPTRSLAWSPVRAGDENLFEFGYLMASLAAVGALAGVRPVERVPATTVDRQWGAQRALHLAALALVVGSVVVIIAVLTSLGVEAKGVAFGTIRRLRTAA